MVPFGLWVILVVHAVDAGPLYVKRSHVTTIQEYEQQLAPGGAIEGSHSKTGKDQFHMRSEENELIPVAGTPVVTMMPTHVRHVLSFARVLC